MTRPYEVYVDGRFAKRCLTLNGAVKIAKRFPNSLRSIFKVEETPLSRLVMEFAKGPASL